MKRLLTCIAAAATFAAQGALAQTTSAVTADELEVALSDAGLSPVMSMDVGSGAPVATGEAGEIKFFVRTLDCAGAPKACSTLVFFANFRLGRAISDSDFRIINRYNESKVFGRAYVIEAEGEVGVDYVIELDGGVDKDHLAGNIGRWSDVLAAFIENFTSGGDASS